MESFVMKKLILAAVLAATLTPGVAAIAQEGTVKAAPVEFRACHYRDGKDAGDLDKVIERFRAYADENNFNYAAWTMVPQYQTGVDYDVGWLGAWPSSSAFGISMERWMASGGELAASFDEVLDCSGRHEMALWVPVTAQESTPEDGVLMIARCSLLEGKTTDEAYRAHIAFGNHMRGLGSMASSWLFYPTLGAGAIDYDYYHAMAFFRYSDLGAALDLYANGGGYAERARTVDKVASCMTPMVFDVESVRGFSN